MFTSRDRYAWCMALTPICVALLERINMALNLLNGEGVPILFNVLMVVGLLVFWILDRVCLSKFGLDKGYWRYWGLVLIPVYLFIRTRKTKGQYYYFAVYIITFLAMILL